MRRMVAVSALLILVGLMLLLPSSELWSLLTTGGSSTSLGNISFGATTDNTTAIESLVAFGLIGVGLVLEILSLFTQSAMQAAENRSAVKP